MGRCSARPVAAAYRPCRHGLVALLGAERGDRVVGDARDGAPFSTKKASLSGALAIALEHRSSSKILLPHECSSSDDLPALLVPLDLYSMRVRSPCCGLSLGQFFMLFPLHQVAKKYHMGVS